MLRYRAAELRAGNTHDFAGRELAKTDRNGKLATLAAPQREALTSAVKKLTDGKSQADFFEELYKGASGNGTPVSGPHKNLSISEEAALRKQQALKQWSAIEKLLAAYRDKFLCGLTDADVEAQMASLERALSARKAWLKQPASKRVPAAISEMFNTK